MTTTGKQKSYRRKLFDLHSWLGFNLAVFMSLVIITGTLAVVADEIDWLFHKELRAQPGNHKVSWGEMQQAIREYAPNDTLSMLSAGEGDYFTYRALMYDKFGKTYYLYVDPISGEVTGTTSTLTVQRFLRDLHRYLFMPSIIGLPLVTTMSVVLLISLYTGLKTVRNWRTVATRIRINRGTRVAVGDFHKAAGLWGSWFLILMVVTSFWYFAELSFAVGGVRFEPNRPGITLERAAKFGEIAELADADMLVAAAEAAFPGFQATEIQFATQPTLAVTVLGHKDDPFVRKRANRVFLDPGDASIIKVQRSTDINWVAYVNELADPFHFGQFRVLTIKLIWFLFGLGLVSLTITGVYLTWKRLKKITPSTAQLATLPLIAVVSVFGFSYIKNYITHPAPKHYFSLPPKDFNDVNVEVIIPQDDKQQPNGEVILQASAPSARLNLSSGQVKFNGADFTVDMRPEFLGSTVTLYGSAPPEVFTELNTLSVTLNFLPGQSTTRHWQIDKAKLSAN